MTNKTTRIIVVGMMQTPPYDRMFVNSRRVYPQKEYRPRCIRKGWAQRDKGVGGALSMSELRQHLYLPLHTVDSTV